MNRLTLPIAFVAVALALAVIADGGMAAEGAARKTPTPTPSPTPTPTAQPSPSPTVCPIGLPALPSPRMVCSSGYICWIDNSNNEDGFHIGITRCRVSYHFEVPANTTSFTLPPETADPCCGDWDKITAFNACGQSTLTTEFGALCLPPTATPPVVVMPAGGVGSLKVQIVVENSKDFPTLSGDIVSVELSPPVATAKTTNVDSGTTLIENLPAGRYKVTVRLSNGVEISRDDINIAPGVEGVFSSAIKAPSLDGVDLPNTGAGDRGGSAPAWWGMGLLAGGVASLGAGVALFARSRMQSKSVQ